MPEAVRIRPAKAGDVAAITRIFNEGVADRVATFETGEQSREEIAAQLTTARLTLVAERAGEVEAFARVSAYSDPHPYYAGVGEATLYVARAARRAGTGRALLEALAGEAAAAGLHKLVGKIFTSNSPSIALARICGWREVGVHLRHGTLDGEWKDVLVVERLLGESA